MARTSVLCQLLLVSCCISLVVVNAMPMPSRKDDSSESFKERNLETSMEAGGCPTGGCQPVGCPTGGCQPTGCPTGGCPGNEERNLEIETSQEAEPADERAGTISESSVEETGSEYEDPATGCIDASCRNQGAARRPVPCTSQSCTPVTPAPAPCTSPSCTPTATAGATRTTPQRKPAPRRPSPAAVEPAAPCPTCTTIALPVSAPAPCTNPSCTPIVPPAPTAPCPECSISTEATPAKKVPVPPRRNTTAASVPPAEPAPAAPCPTCKTTTTTTTCTTCAPTTCTTPGCKTA